MAQFAPNRRTELFFTCPDLEHTHNLSPAIAFDKRPPRDDNSSLTDSFERRSLNARGSNRALDERSTRIATQLSAPRAARD